MKVRFALSVGSGGVHPERLAAVVDAAEDAGLDGLWCSDLTVTPGVDPYQAVAFAAARRRRLKMGVTIVPFGATPWVVARQVASLDRLLGGGVLVTLVPGLDAPGERQALGTVGVHRGRRLDELVPVLRSWWAGEAVEGLALPLPPLRRPEIWLGGRGPEAIRRAGRLAEGWLGSMMPPAEAGRLRRAIQEQAAAAGRAIDPEHFGLSVPYARREDDLAGAGQLRRRPLPPGAPDPVEVVPVGAPALRRLVGELVAEGLSKFVLRPIGAGAAPAGEEVAWLADAVLDLQT